MSHVARLRGLVPLPYYAPEIQPGTDSLQAVVGKVGSGPVTVLTTDTTVRLELPADLSSYTYISDKIRVVSGWMRFLQSGLYSMESILKFCAGDSGTYSTFLSTFRVLSLRFRAPGTVPYNEFYYMDSIPQATISTSLGGILNLPSWSDADALFKLYVPPECVESGPSPVEFQPYSRVDLLGGRIHSAASPCDLSMQAVFDFGLSFVSPAHDLKILGSNGAEPLVFGPGVERGDPEVAEQRALAMAPIVQMPRPTVAEAARTDFPRFVAPRPLR